MKKAIMTFICTSVLLSPINVQGKEVQLSDYRYTKCARLMDGYTYCENGKRGEILTPDGHKLYSNADYTAIYSAGEEGHGEGIISWIQKPISYPQGEMGNVFIVQSPGKKAMGLMKCTVDPLDIYGDSTELITPVEYDEIRLMGPNYFRFRKYSNNGILSAKDGHVVGESEKDIYIGDNMLNYAFARVYTEKGRKYAAADFYNGDGIKIQSIEGEDISKSPFYDRENELLKDSYGNTYRKVDTDDRYRYYEDTFHRKQTEPWEFSGYDVLEPHAAGAIGVPDRIDRKYTFKSKEIGDKTYYAVFADMDEDKSKEYDNEGIKTLIGESQYSCREDNISRQDFCILLLNTYMYDRQQDIGDFAEDVDIADLHFDDTDDVYVRLAVKLGLIDCITDSVFMPYGTLTRAEAAVSFNRLARLMRNRSRGFGRKFSDTDGCTTEEKSAIKSLARLKNEWYGDVIEKNGETAEDEKFYPTENIKAEDAYDIAYKLATYNKAGESREYMDMIRSVGMAVLCGVGAVCFAYSVSKRKKPAHKI